MSSKIHSFKFGTVVVDGRKYHRDIIISADGAVRERKGGIWRFGPHSINKEEIEALTGAEVAVIGLGTLSRAHLSGAAKDYVDDSKLELLLLSSHEATEKINELMGKGRRVAALLHITC